MVFKSSELNIPPWYRFSYGQAEPPQGETFVAISSGEDHTCGLRADETPVCWGTSQRNLP